jgi:hypothetical protein
MQSQVARKSLACKDVNMEVGEAMTLEAVIRQQGKAAD